MDAFSDGGSTPPASTKQKDTPNGVSFCLGAIGSFQCLAEINSACAKVFAWGENACTAQRRRPTVWGPKSYRHLYCFDVTKRKTSAFSRCLSFFLPPHPRCRPKEPYILATASFSIIIDTPPESGGVSVRVFGASFTPLPRGGR